MTMDILDDFPYNQYGQLVSRKKYVRTTVRNYKNMLSATMDLTIAEVTITANERYALLQEEEFQRTAIAVATFTQPADATVGQPTLTEAERGWLFTQVINSFQPISVIGGTHYCIFTNKKHALNTYINYYLKATALLLNVLERQKVSSRPAYYSMLLY
jgi:hypothetical protein